MAVLPRSGFEPTSNDLTIKPLTSSTRIVNNDVIRVIITSIYLFISHKKKIPFKSEYDILQLLTCFPFPLHGCVVGLFQDNEINNIRHIVVPVTSNQNYNLRAT
jgi:hypothetical protein